MATRHIGEVIIAQADYQRGDLFKEIDHDRVANAIRYLSFAKLYYPDKYHEFVKVVALHHATWSMEDSNFIAALYEFERGFSEFLASHPTIQQEVNRLSPKQMVDRVDTEEVANAKERRDAARKTAQRVIASATRRGAQAPREEEIEAVVRSAAIEAETPAQLQQFIKARIPIAAPAIDQIVQEDPRVMQQLLLSDPESTRGVLDQTMFSPLPNKRALHAIITNLPMDPNETREQFLDRAASVARTAVVLSSDLSQTPLPQAAPGGFIEAILSVQKDRRAIDALAAFNKLTERAKNAVSLAVVAKAWEDTVDVITKRAGGAIAQSIEPIIREANKQPVGGSIKHAASLVGDVLGPLLGPAFTNAVEIEALNRSLPPGQKLFSDKNSVVTFIESLDAARRAEGAASAALFLTVTTHYPGVQFVKQPSENPLAPVVTIVQFAKDSIAWKIVDRAAKSEVVSGFFGKILQPVLGFFGIRLGAQAVAGKAAGAAAGKGFSALVGSLLGGTVAPIVGHIVGFVGGFFVMPIIQKVGGWIKNLVTGRVGQLKVAQDAILGALNPQTAGTGAQDEQKKTDFMIMLIVGVPIIILIAASVLQVATQSSAIVTSFEASSQRTGGPYTETFPAYSGPFPDGPTSVSTCSVDSKNLVQDAFDQINPVGTHRRTCAYDFNAAFGSVVRATHDGCVAANRAGMEDNVFVEGSYGNYVRLAGTGTDGKPFYSVYAHLAQYSSSHLSVGQCIKAGETVGAVDDNGHSFSTHLHLEYEYESRKPTEEECAQSFSLPAACTN